MGDDEATRLLLDAIFEIRGRVREIHAAILGEDDDEQEAEED
jgi:hypothetical protein